MGSAENVIATRKKPAASMHSSLLLSDEISPGIYQVRSGHEPDRLRLAIVWPDPTGWKSRCDEGQPQLAARKSERAWKRHLGIPGVPS